MRKPTRDTPAPAPEAAPAPAPAENAIPAHRDWPADQFTGRPGRYMRDPVTGVRTPNDDVARAVAAEIEAQRRAAAGASPAGAPAVDPVSNPTAEGQ